MKKRAGEREAVGQSAQFAVGLTREQIERAERLLNQYERDLAEARARGDG